MEIFHLKPPTDHLQTEMSRPSEETEDDLGPPVDTNRIIRSLKTSISLGQSVETFILISILVILDYSTAVHLDIKNESKVLVLYTGGTIGMVRNRAGVLVPEANAMEANIRRNVTMHDESYSSERFADQVRQFQH